jgi:hypothetical protein
MTVQVGEETLFARAPGRLILAAGAQVRLGWEPRDAHLFDAKTGMRVDVDQGVREASGQYRKTG